MSFSPATDTTLVQSYLDGELSGSDLEEFERHLGESDELRTVVREMRAEHEKLRELLAAPSAPRSLLVSVHRGLDGIDGQRSRERRRQLFAWLLPGSATLAAAAALIVFVTVGGESAPPATGDRSVAHDAVQQRLRQQPIELVSARRALPKPTVMGQPVAFSSSGAARPSSVVPGRERATGSSRVLSDYEITREMSRSLSKYFQSRVEAPYFESAAVRVRGWRPSQLLGRAAAELQYEVETGDKIQTLTVQIVNARELELRGRRKVAVNGRPVWLDQAYGYSAVLFKDEFAIGYVFISEMSQRQLLDLVATGSNAVRPIHRRQ